VGSLFEGQHLEQALQPLAGRRGQHLGDLVGPRHVLLTDTMQPWVVGRRHRGGLVAHCAQNSTASLPRARGPRNPGHPGGHARTIGFLHHWGFAVSPDERTFLYTAWPKPKSDIVLVENFR
jgi:hypothetical protein